ncbi:MAG: apolipoprotein N-acyltransferase, partial [Deltaproteobacteria bacterium]|nr:apolipoprotein N-acyltransferase [Deltaproteobacteria bacterium]
MFHFIKLYKDYLLFLLSSVLIVLSFPKIEISGLIWTAMVPLFFALEHQTPKQALIMGFVMGFLVSIGAFHWVLYTLQVFGGLPLWIAFPIFLIFCSFCNIHLALFPYLLKRFPLHLPPLFWIPALYTVLEFLTPQIFLNVFIYELVRWIKKDTEVFPASSLAVTLSYLLLAGIYSAFQLQDLRELMTKAPSIRAALVQTNVGNLEKIQGFQGTTWAIQKAQDINETLVLKAAKEKNIDLFVLPETSVPGFFTADRPTNREIMFNLASRAGAPLFFGGYNKEDDQTYNSTFLISNFFQILGSYDKIKLLIFGEYFPFASALPFLKNIIPQSIGDFSRGKNMNPLSFTKDFKLVPLICFEGIFPDFVRRFVKKGGSFIITVTNDSWFGKTSCPYQHLMLHVWRAIENRTPMLRCANTGISAFIDLTGKIQSQTKIFKEEILIDQVSPAKVRELAMMALGLGEYQPSGVTAEAKILDWMTRVSQGMKMIDKTGVKRLRLPEFWRDVTPQHLGVSQQEFENAWRNFDFSQWLKLEGLSDAEISSASTAGTRGWDR